MGGRHIKLLDTAFKMPSQAQALARSQGVLNPKLDIYQAVNKSTAFQYSSIARGLNLGLGLN